jgi:hypothetical protein
MLGTIGALVLCQLAGEPAFDGEESYEAPPEPGADQLPLEPPERESEPEMFWGTPEEPVRDEPRRVRPNQPKRTPYRHVVLGRLSLATGIARQSEHSQLLAQDGYALGQRTYGEVALAGVLGSRFALGAYVGYGRRSAGEVGPTLHEEVTRYGAEISLVLQPAASYLVTLGPSFGVVHAALGVSDDPPTQTVAEYGAIATLLGRLSTRAPIWYLGATVAYTLAPADPPGSIGRDYDYGALYLGLAGVIGG